MEHNGHKNIQIYKCIRNKIGLHCAASGSDEGAYGGHLHAGGQSPVQGMELTAVPP